ncbi:MAG: hypothetical protein AMJ79_05435 [Phycisphaerae bacterium SM23_30]|nr:MAG: hypothetical protein AMJ79_05435 [Phycisphaerae bacterium SM23_30]
MNDSLYKRSFSNILVIKPSSLGDVVRCLPVLAGLRSRYPKANISWLVRPDCADVLKTSGHLNKIIEFDRYHYGKISRSFRAASDFYRFCIFLRQRRFDLVLDLQGLFRSGFFAFCTGAPIRMGFAHARELAGLFYTHRVSVPYKAEHVVDSYWRFGQYLGFFDQTKKFDLPIDPVAEKRARKMLIQSQLPAKKPFAVLLIGGTRRAKRWPPDRFAALAEALHKRYRMASVLLGAGATEGAAAKQLLKKAACAEAHPKVRNAKKNIQIVNLVNKTNLLEAAAIIKNARLVVGNDSGPLHMAAALAVPLVGLYGPTDPVVVGPYGQSDGVVRAGSATQENERYSKKPEHRIENITLEEVLETVESKIDY